MAHIQNKLFKFIFFVFKKKIFSSKQQNCLALVFILCLISACSNSGKSENNSNGFAAINNAAPPNLSSQNLNSVSWTRNNYNGDPWDVHNYCETPRSGVDTSGDAYNDTLASVSYENQFLRLFTYNYYLWNTEVDDVDPNSINSASDYFDLMKTQDPKDKYHYTIPTETYQNQQQGNESRFGFTLSWIAENSAETILVTFVEPNSNAEKQGLKRGDIFISINDMILTTSSRAEINAELSKNTLSATVRRNTDTIELSLTREAFELNPVPIQTVINYKQKKYGYLLFNSHIEKANNLLIEAINTFKTEGIDELILDLRFNRGGLVNIANRLAYMISGSTDTFSTPKYNNLWQEKDFFGNPIVSKPFINEYNNLALPSLKLSQLIVLTSPVTCSASELIINALKGIDINIIQIGESTCGKPFGFYPIDNCGTTYFTIMLTQVNKKGFGEYYNGFSAVNITESQVNTMNSSQNEGCFVSDDVSYPLGHTNENLLKHALHYLDTKSCISNLALTQLRFNKRKETLNSGEFFGGSINELKQQR